MTYIPYEQRKVFADHIHQTLSTMNSAGDNFYTKGEYFGYFVNRCVKKFLGDPNYTANAFNSANFQPSVIKTLANTADSVAASLSRSDAIADAAKLNYVITAVLWGFLGEAKSFPQAGYGIRAYMEGILDKIKSDIDEVNSGSKSDATMAFRRHLIIRGVLSHVIQETYRLKTSEYLDGKWKETGDPWQDGSFSYVESQ